LTRVSSPGGALLFSADWMGELTLAQHRFKIG